MAEREDIQEGVKRRREEKTLDIERLEKEIRETGGNFPRRSSLPRSPVRMFRSVEEEFYTPEKEKSPEQVEKKRRVVEISKAKIGVILAKAMSEAEQVLSKSLEESAGGEGVEAAEEEDTIIGGLESVGATTEEGTTTDEARKDDAEEEEEEGAGAVERSDKFNVK